jgi:hypothetical protein
VIITIDHLHSVPTWNGRQGFCHKQSRAFFQRHGLDWMKFLREGIEAELLLATDDALARHLVEHALKECGHE